MIRRKIQRFVEGKRCTLLGVGPMSLNCINATIELSNEFEVPIMMIASRRQIEAEDLGGGYVNRWSTESFAKYVIDNDKKGKIILSRDHGGPWQNIFEKQNSYSLRRAMESAKKSFKTDIESGFELIHIDGSEDIFGVPSIDEVLQRVFELYEYCWNIAQSMNKQVIFEIGTESQTGSTNMIDELECVLSETWKFCDANKLPRPTFVVVQTGTRVMEMQNIGSFDSPIRIEYELPAAIQVPKIIDICNKYDIFMKEHNVDYLSDEALMWHPKLGIHAANIAPEFGVIETKSFIKLLKDNSLIENMNRFIELSYNSRKWEKWVLPKTNAGTYEKAILAGHYVFSDPQFIEIKKESQSKLNSLNINIDDYLKNEIKKGIMRYLNNFRLLRI